MAATTMTPSRFASSLSGGGVPYSSTAPSMADTLPSIDFNFNDLRERMAHFTARFDDFIEKGRKRVLQERNAFRLNVAEIEETQRNQKEAIAGLEHKSSWHAQALEREAQETAEMHAAIASLDARKQAHGTRRDGLKHDIAALQTSIKQRREAQHAYQRALDAQARHNVPELRFWEACLGMRIEGAGAGAGDVLRFVFTFEGEKEAWFELLMGGREYEVGATKPKLDRERVDALVGGLNEGRELGSFLKGVRALFVEGFRG